MSEVEVSVICLAYNHEKYIERCLEGFVRQKTDFLFEVFIHDDASTDNTAEIIKQYAHNYPDIIKPIFQQENKYSKSIPIIKTYIAPLIKGKYIAICEGDDCWIDDQKLQIQYDYMTEHPECSICTHNAIVRNYKNNETWVVTQERKERDYTIEEIIKSGGNLFATNSIFIKREFYLNQPSCFRCPGVGDYQIVFYAAIQGRCHYLPSIMSKYNANTTGSWTDRIWNNPEKRIQHLKEFIAMLNAVNDYYNHRFELAIYEKITSLEFEILKLTGDYSGMRKKKYRVLYKEYLKKNKYLYKEIIYKRVNIKAPVIIDTFKKIKNAKKKKR